MLKLRFGALLTMLLLGSMIKAQNITSEELIGSWEVSKVVSMVEEVPVDQKELVENLKIAFEESSFNFEADHKFSFDFAFEEIQIKSGHWKLSEGTNSIVVKHWTNKTNSDPVLMEIKVEKDAGKVYFTPAESFFTLEMTKK